MPLGLPASGRTGAQAAQKNQELARIAPHNSSWIQEGRGKKDANKLKTGNSLSAFSPIELFEFISGANWSDEWSCPAIRSKCELLSCRTPLFLQRPRKIRNQQYAQTERLTCCREIQEIDSKSRQEGAPRQHPQVCLLLLSSSRVLRSLLVAVFGFRQGAAFWLLC